MLEARPAAPAREDALVSDASGSVQDPSRSALDEARLRLALEAGGMGTWAWDLASNRVTWDEAMEARYGLAPGSFPGTFEAFLELVHPNDVVAARLRIEQALLAGDDLRYEHRIVWPNGEVHWLEGRGRVIHDDQGRPAAMIGIGMDIDGRKASETAVAQANRMRSEHARSAIEVLQETLVPADFPAIPGYELAGRYIAAESEHNIGGDWYDAFAVTDDQILVSVGDVSGHGVLAGRTMAKMRHASRAFACEDPDPASVVRRLDNFFQHLRHGDEIVTTCVGLLDLATHTIELASAGHLPPLLLDRGERTFLDLDVGPPLGFSTDVHGAGTRIAFPVGATLLLYTDGLVERRGEDIDDGLERFARAAGAVEPGDVAAARDAVIASCIGLREDDLCLLVLTRTGA
jgi:PAS domain S-box-containing protein